MKTRGTAMQGEKIHGGLQPIQGLPGVSHPVLERNRMHLTYAPGPSSAHIIDYTSVYSKQCHNKIEYYSTLLHDRKS
jgi:hypothetical protein